MPNGEQQRDKCRFVYNKALALQKENHKAGNKFVCYVPVAANLPLRKRESVAERLKKAYANFFAKRTDFPRFKNKGSGDSFRYPDTEQTMLDQTNDRSNRDVLGEVRNLAVSRSVGKWFTSIQTQREVEQPLPTATCAIGIVRFATMSHESFIAPLNRFKKHQTSCPLPAAHER
jgi:putative transposase